MENSLVLSTLPLYIEKKVYTAYYHTNKYLTSYHILYNLLCSLPFFSLITALSSYAWTCSSRKKYQIYLCHFCLILSPSRTVLYTHFFISPSGSILCCCSVGDLWTFNPLTKFPHTLVDNAPLFHVIFYFCFNTESRFSICWITRPECK